MLDAGFPSMKLKYSGLILTPCILVYCCVLSISSYWTASIQTWISIRGFYRHLRMPMPPPPMTVRASSVVGVSTSRRLKSVLVDLITIRGAATTKEDGNWRCTVYMVVAVEGSEWYWLAATFLHMICWKFTSVVDCIGKSFDVWQTRRMYLGERHTMAIRFLHSIVVTGFIAICFFDEPHFSKLAK